MLIEFRDRRLSVRIRNAPWDQVIKEVSRRTGVTIEVMGTLNGTVSQEFEALPLEEGLTRLFGDADFVFSTPNQGQAGAVAAPSIRAWVFPKAEGVGGQAHLPSPGHMPTAQAEAPAAVAQLTAEAPGETAAEGAVAEAVEEAVEEAAVQEELPGTEILVREDEPVSEVEILGEEGHEGEQSSPGPVATAQAEAPAAAAQLAAGAPGEMGAEGAVAEAVEETVEEAAVEEELPGTEIWVRDDAPVSEVEILGEEEPELEE
jgi:hypothetical protein